jgi:hypothetical protein
MYNKDEITYNQRKYDGCGKWCWFQNPDISPPYLQRNIAKSAAFVKRMKGKAIPLQALTDPEGFRRFRFPDF